MMVGLLLCPWEVAVVSDVIIDVAFVIGMVAAVVV